MLDFLKTQGIIVKAEPLGENGALVSVFTRQRGLIYMRALGIKKHTSKLASSVLPGNVVYITCVKKTGWHLTGAKVVAYTAVNFLEKNAFFCFGAVREVLTSLMIQEQRDDELYRSLKEYVTAVHKKYSDALVAELLAYSFILKVFMSQGIYPNRSICQKGGEKIDENDAFYWLKNKGFICEHCQKKLSDTDTIMITPQLKKVFEKNLSIPAATTFPQKEFKNLQNIINDIYESEVEKPIQSLTFFK